VKELLKSDSICQSSAQKKKGPVFFDSQCICNDQKQTNSSNKQDKWTTEDLCFQRKQYFQLQCCNEYLSEWAQSRSLKMATFNRLQTSSYLPSIVTTASDIKTDRQRQTDRQTEGQKCDLNSIAAFTTWCSLNSNKKLITRWDRRTLPPEPHHPCKTLPTI